MQDMGAAKNGVCCAVCGDSGLLLSSFCPLCDGHGLCDLLALQQASTPTERGRLYIKRVLRTGRREELDSEKLSDIEFVLASKNRRRQLEDERLLKTAAIPAPAQRGR